MINVRKSKLSDFEGIKLSENLPAFTYQFLLHHGISILMASRSAMTAEVKGRTLVIADTFPYKDGLYMWALFDRNVNGYSIALARVVKRALGMFKGVTIYAHANSNYWQGQRLLSFLGFSLTTKGDIEFKGETYDLYIKDNSP